MQKLPLGEQHFERLREDGALYVDKTELMYQMVNYSNYIFLSRPRRFGKSLLASTLEALYQGKKELFKGLWIEDKWTWESYPVIRLDFSKIKHSATLEQLEDSLMIILDEYAEEYKVTLKGKSVSTRLGNLLSKVYKKTNKRVVILIDEYDKPITNHLINIKKAERNKTYLRDIYVMIKANSEYVHFFFITGISKFAKVSIFSVINNLKDISLLPRFNNIVGFTKIEMEQYFPDYLQQLSQKMDMDMPILMSNIAHWYNGYSWDGQHKIYNPFAILNLFRDLAFENYWFETGTPSFLIDLIKKRYTLQEQNKSLLEEFEGLIASKSTFDSYDLEDINLTALLFQSGYLTVEEKRQAGLLTSYKLNYPNYEVKLSFNAHLIKAFSKKDIAADIEGKALYLLDALKTGNKDNFVSLIHSIFSGIPSDILRKVNEYTYQSLFYQLLTLLGVKNVILEVTNHVGRADGVLFWDEKVFVFEFKFARKGTMKALLDGGTRQILKQDYVQPFLKTGQPVYRVAVGFLYKKLVKDKSPVLSIDAEWVLVKN